MAPVGELEAGRLVAERYRLVQKLGEGGMGVVWEAEHTLTGRAFALKILKATGEAAQARFLREARTLTRVRHPNVVDIYDVVRLDDGRPALVMDLLEGESLAALLARIGKLELGATCAILLPVVEAVGFAHAAGVVHRDLKPDNVFLVRPSPGPTPTVKVLDFGIAKLTPGADAPVSLTTSGAILGTPYYMSPEQLFGEKDIDARSDVWSLGVMLYECLAGVRPTEGDSLGQVLRRIATSQLPPLEKYCPDLPADVFALVGRALSLDRGRRPTPEELAALFAYHRDPAGLVPSTAASVRGVPNDADARGLVPLPSDRPGPAAARAETPSTVVDAHGATHAADVPAASRGPNADEAATRRERRASSDVSYTGDESSPVDGASFAPKAQTPSSALDAVRTTGSVTRERGASSYERRLPRRWVALGVAVGAVAAAVGAGLVRHVEPVANPPLVASSPAPVSTVPAAQTVYEQGLDSLRHRGIQAGFALLERALVLDPSCVAAEARLAVGYLNPDAGTVPTLRYFEAARRHFREARRQSSKLTRRELELLDAHEPLTFAKPDVTTFRDRMEHVGASYADDAEIQFLLSAAEERDGRHDVAIKVMRNVVDLDPSYGPAYGQLALWELGRGNHAAAWELFENCVRHTPATALCRNFRARDLRAQGKCAELEREGRDWEAADPENGGGYTEIANALFAQGKPVAAVRAMVEKSSTLLSHSVPGRASEVMGKTNSAAVETIAGEFDRALRDYDTVVFDTARLDNRNDLIDRRAEVSLESAGVAATLGFLTSVVRQRSAWSDLLPLDVAQKDAALAHLRYVNKTGTRAEFVAARERALSRLLGWCVDDGIPANICTEELKLIVAYDYRPLTETDAHELLDAARGKTWPHAGDLLFEAYARLGDANGVLATLSTRSQCASYEDPISEIRRHLWLGMAYEKNADVENAKREYETLLSYWGEAKPRSVSADEARVRLKKLAGKP